MSTQHLQEKWAPVLGHQDLPEIKDSYRAAVTAQLLENQERFMEEQAALGAGGGLLSEAPPTLLATVVSPTALTCCCRSYRWFRPRHDRSDPSCNA